MAVQLATGGKSSATEATEVRKSPTPARCESVARSGGLWPSMAVGDRGDEVPTHSAGKAGSGVLPQRLCNDCLDEQNAVVSAPVSAKLVVGAADDPLERQADGIADAVMAQSAVLPIGADRDAGMTLRRRCLDCENDETALQRKRVASGAASAGPAVTTVATRASGGEPVSPAVRERVEPVLRSDLSAVRVHVDSAAGQAAAAINAKAFTVNNNIFLGPGQRADDTRLMAHELAHTVQQNGRESVIRRSPSTQSSTSCPQFNEKKAATVTNDGVEVYTVTGYPTHGRPDGTKARDENNAVLQLPADMELHVGGEYTAKAKDRSIPLYSICLVRGKLPRELFWIEQRHVEVVKSTGPQAASKGSATEADDEPVAATDDEKLKLILSAKPAGDDHESRAAWETRLRKFMDRVPKKKAQALTQRLAPASNDELGKYFRLQISDQHFRLELIDRLNKVDIALKQLERGEYATVIRQLNPMWMKMMLKRIQGFDTTHVEKLMAHVDDGKLDERSKFRVLAALGTVYMIHTGVTTEKLDVLDGYMASAVLPEQQRGEIREVLPKLPGGAATRVNEVFEQNKKIAKPNDAGIDLTKLATAKVFDILHHLPADELQETLQHIDKSQLRALMKNSRQAEKFGEGRVEELRQALYAAWISRFPTETVEFDVGEKTNPILNMTTGAKLIEAMRRSVDRMPGEFGERVKEMLTPEAIATIAAFAVAYVVSQTTPIGWVADIIIAGLIAATIVMVGSEAVEIVKLLIRFCDKATNATSDKDFDEAADAFAKATSKVGIDIIMAILFHKAGKSANLKPPKARSPGLAEVLFPKGGRATTTIAEPQTSGQLVTPNGVRFIDNFTSAMAMAEAEAASTPKAAPGTGKGSAGTTPKQAPIAEPPSAKTPPPGQDLAAGGGVAKKPPSPGKVLDDIADIAGKNKSAAPVSAAEANAAAKNSVLNKLEASRELKAQILDELRELADKKSNYVDEDGVPLAKKRKELVAELDKVVEAENKLNTQLGKLEISLYDRSRAFSYSNDAARAVTKRARGLDEMSGSKLQEPSIDHVVPIKEIVEMEGFHKLSETGQRAILSMVENLRMMEKALNSSKGNKRWADWAFGRQRYGDAVWQKMVKLEGELRGKIQQQITDLLAAKYK